jgi:pimeloyl-ACP methyl ester carboxylesterase
MKSLAKLIIRPLRASYNPEVDLGPPQFLIKGKIFKRTDLTLVNSRGFLLQCSWFEPKSRVQEQIPCVVYCHGNSGSRLDAFEVVETMLSLRISVFVFDFSGSGLSDGKYVSLGYYENRDIKVVVDYLMSAGSVSRVALWGRSMGAVSSVMYASRDPRIACLVLDSLFTSLKELIGDLSKTYKYVPNALISYFIEKVRRKVVTLAEFDFEEVNTTRYIKSCLMPAAFIHGLEDTLVDIKHSQALFETYRGEKLLFEIDGTHNSVRNTTVVNQVGIFLKDALSRTNFYAEEDDLDIPPETDRPTLLELHPSLRVKLGERSNGHRRRRRPRNEEQCT